MKNKLNLALVAVSLQILIWIINFIFPLTFQTSGSGIHSFYNILYTFCVFAPLPFFIAMYKNKTTIKTTKTQTESHSNTESSTSLLKHLATRILLIIGIFVLTYVVITAGKSDPMGYGLYFAGIACVGLTFIVLIVDASRIYKKEADSSKYYANIIILAILGLGIISFLAMN